MRPTHLVIAVATVGMLAAAAGCSKPGSAATDSKNEKQTPIVAVEAAAPADLSQSLTLTAEFIPYQEVDVMAKVSGYVRKINVDIGDHVRAGQVLATLEVPEMADDLQRASANVQLSDAQIKRAQDDIHRAEAAHDVAHLAYQRLLDVSKTKPGLVAQQEIDEAHGKDLVSEAQVSAAESTLAVTNEQRQAYRAEQSRYGTLYRYATVTAPFDGVVTMRYASQGSMIQAGTASQSQAMPVVRVSQNKLLRLMLPVPESAVPFIHAGEAVQVNVSSLNRVFEGKVVRFTNKVATSTRTMLTEVDVPNPNAIIIPGMYADVSLHTTGRPRALSVPVMAVDMTGAAPQVYRIASDESIEAVPVKLGLETSNRVEIVSGISPGDRIVVGPRAGLKPGDKVQPKMVEMPQPKADS